MPEMAAGRSGEIQSMAAGNKRVFNVPEDAPSRAAAGPDTALARWKTASWSHNRNDGILGSVLR